MNRAYQVDTQRIRWKRSTGNFVNSHCGFWHITPVYAGLTRPKSYKLWFGASAWKRIGSGQTQHACKVEADWALRFIRVSYKTRR